MAQTDADRAAGIIRFTFGSEPAECRSLPYAYGRQWLRGYQTALDALGQQFPEDVSDLTEDEAVDYAYQTGAVILDAVKEFDREGQLPTREWLVEHATPAQIDFAIEDMKEACTAPFVRSAAAILIRKVAASSRLNSSTNGHSRTGSETRENLTKPSRRTR